MHGAGAGAHSLHCAQYYPIVNHTKTIAKRKLALLGARAGTSCRPARTHGTECAGAPYGSLSYSGRWWGGHVRQLASEKLASRKCFIGAGVFPSHQSLAMEAPHTAHSFLYNFTNSRLLRPNIYLRLTIATTPVGRGSYAFSPVTVSYESSIQSLYIASVGAFYDT